MTKIVFINNKNLDIMDEPEDFFYCDSEIALTISELNKKGYKTMYSCAGHNTSGYIDRVLLPLEQYEDWIKEFGSHQLVINVEQYDNKSFLYMSKHTITTVYIKFAEKYEIDSIPNGFTIEYDGDGTIIKKTIFYFNDEGKWENRKKQIEIDREIEEARQVILEWAKNIKPVNEKGMNK